MNAKIIVIAIIGAAIIGGGSFFAGTKFASTSSRPSLAQMGPEAQKAGSNAMGDRPGMGGATAGEITAKDAASITVKLTGGSSPLLVGESVMVIGAPSADGSASVQPGQRGALQRPAGGMPPGAPAQ